jgi:hypothetical protein
VTEPDAKDWETRLEAALRAERDWREKGREVVEIFRAERTADGAAGRGRFNMLYANTSILSPVMYQQPPRADVRRRTIPADSVADRAADVLQAALNVAVDAGDLDCELRRLVQDLLLPGRGVLRVRWAPVVRPVPLSDAAGLPVQDAEGRPVTEPRKVWESVEFDHVFWEDFVCEPVRRWKDVGWCAFRHYLTRTAVETGFGDGEAAARLLADEAWCRGAFVHRPAEHEDEKHGADAVEKRALVWECWDRETRTVSFVAMGPDGAVFLRRDGDRLKLKGFFPCAEPLTAVTTGNTMVPVPEYEIYRDLAAEIARLTERIDAIMQRMRVRGLFNGSIEELADALEGEDGKMIPVAAVEMEALASNIWMIPLDMLAQTAMALYGAREQSKQALYEVTGISDVLRGASVASETATAQRIKGNFGTLRIDDRRRALNACIRDTLRIAAEIVATCFSAETLAVMTSRTVDAEVESFLRNDVLLLCRVDIESDSTIAADEVAEQESSARLVQAAASILQTFGPLVQSGMAPPRLVGEVLKLALRPFKGARDLMGLLDQLSEAAAAGLPAPAQPPVDEEAAVRLQARREALAMERERHALAMAEGRQDMDIERRRLALDTARAIASATARKGERP